VERALPSGTVTFLFTDVEGSTKLLHELGADQYSNALGEHRRLLRAAFTSHGGAEIDTQGDAFFVVFPDEKEAVAAAAEAQQGLSEGPIRVRMGLHTGKPILTEEGYIGEDVHKGARIASASHGGQVVLSRETALLLGDAFPLTDLGEHRVKDFTEPVWIFQLGDQTFPPLKTISNTNLPKPASSFIGRERELSELTALLRDGARLVTLTGPGGSGKTRLAIEAASELVPEHRNGVFWVGLAALRDPSLVQETIGQTVGAADGLAEHIGEREMLLLVDNFEQVADAAPVLSALIETCPNLRLLVTSRELLRLRGELEYSVPPLADSEAVDLFRTRAQVDADQTVSELCRRLDNLPLAIELAAARTKVLSPAQILERLSKRLDLLRGGRDAEARQQTLRATIEWSHDLLTPEEQRLFARLSVFRGGCTVEAAEEVVDADLDTLQSLVEKNLLRYRDERFWMLETIREFAIERLEESGQGDDMRQRHGEYFLALVEEAEPHVLQFQKHWLDRLEEEHDNFRAALDHFEARTETQDALQLAGTLSDFWDERGHMMEGRRRLEKALGADQRPTAARGKALVGAAALALTSGDSATAKVRAEEALALHRSLGDTRGRADSLLQLGAAVGNEGDVPGARAVLEESLGLFREVGDEAGTLIATRYLSWAHHYLGEFDQEKELLEENLRRARELGNDRMEASSLGALAMIAVEEKRLNDALAMLAECHHIHHNHGDVVQTAINLCRLARVLALTGRAATAVRLLACSDTVRGEMGATMPWVVAMNEETAAIIRSQVDETEFAEEWERGKKLTVEQAVSAALEP
jgi:predicted ATPase/class 3 adenylate cyclase